MGREIQKGEEERDFFPGESSVPTQGGQRELEPLTPYVISGGEVTERCYFEHLNKMIGHRLNLKPEYFGRESCYYDAFPEYIEKIRQMDGQAKIYCVFDWDVPSKKPKLLARHKNFEQKISSDLGIQLCASYPKIEYWFYLHFCSFKSNEKSSTISSQLGTKMKGYFEGNVNKSVCRMLKQEKYAGQSSWVKKLVEADKLAHAIQEAKASVKDLPSSLCNVPQGRCFSYVHKIFEENPHLLEELNKDSTKVE